jgi:transposase
MTRCRIRRIDIDLGEIKQIIEHAGVSDDNRAKLFGVVDTLAWVTQELETKRVSIQRLRKLLFGIKTEKLNNLFGTAADKSATSAASADHPTQPQGDETGQVGPVPGATDTPKKKRKGHGRHSARDYTGANTIHVAHASLQPGAACPLPNCADGKVYPMADPAVVVRIRGQAPLGADVTWYEKYRCHSCGEVFTTQPASAAQSDKLEKYDATAGAMIALLRYGTGMPFHRLEQLQAGFGIPLPSGTQWEVVHSKVRSAELVYAELMLHAAQSNLIHNDDTVARVLALGSKESERGGPITDESDSSKRTGVFTTSIVALDQQGHRIVLFFTGRRHAGENLALVLAHRAAEAKPPIQMSDGLSRNLPKRDELSRALPKRLKTIWANCLSHARRKYADLANAFRPECQHGECQEICVS